MSNYLIFGGKKSGIALYRYLASFKKNKVLMCDDDLSVLDNAVFGGDVIDVADSIKKIETDSFDTVVYTPSIKRNHPLIVAAKKKGIKCFNEFEFGFLNCDSKKVCVTGTDGKTTTVSLIEHLLREGNLSCVAVGNIGIPFSEKLNDLKDSDIVVAEVSSFMLADSAVISPDVAVVTNIAPDHLDWHGNFDSYVTAKSNIARFLRSDALLIVNADDVYCASFAKITRAETWWFSVSRKVSRGAYWADGYLCFSFDGKIERIVEEKELALKGRHNVANILAAVLVAKRAGLSIGAIRDALKSFGQIPHRQEALFFVNKVLFVNDSKATSVHAAMSAIERFSDRRLCVILGGYDKGEDFDLLFSNYNVKKVDFYIFLGATGSKLVDAALRNGITSYCLAENLSDAVYVGFNKLSKLGGGVLLLSPACASYDRYENFEARGNDFRNIAEEIKRHASD